MPRSDLKVSLNGVDIKAGLALGSCAAFRRIGNQTEVTGDLVLAENEVGPVMQKLTLASFAGLRAFKLAEPAIIGGAAIAGVLLYRQ
jgi:hypothetical protein